MMYRKILKYPAVFVLVSGLCLAAANVSADSQSVVIGRLTGTLYKPPHYLVGNSPTVGGSRGSVEIRGFRLTGGPDGKTYLIRPLADGYFRQSLPPGEYSLVRQRRDRPSYREENAVRILSFTVPANSLVNLGTLEIVLQGKPEEIRFRASSPSSGTYIYRYRYARVAGEEALSAPLEWFKKEAAGKYSGGVTVVNAAPIDLMDSSRFILREATFRFPLID